MAEMQFRRLSLEYSENLLRDFYYDIYLPAFPLFDEREDFELWSGLLRDKTALPASEIVLAGSGFDTDSPRVAGGQGVEYYPRSRCGLLTYLVLAPEFRGKGLSRPLVKAGLEAIDSLAGNFNHQSRPRAYFSETNDPRNPNSLNDSQDPRQRVMMLDKLGFYLVDFPYVQPRLKNRGERYYGLKLMIHLQTWGITDYPSAPRHLELESWILDEYLKEFYLVTEGEIEEPDPDLEMMKTFLSRHPRLTCRPLRELLD